MTMIEKIQGLWVQTYKLKTTLLLLILAWIILVFEYPMTDGPPPRWITAIWALAKVTIGVCYARIVTKELWHTIGLSKIFQDYQTAVALNRPDLAQPAAIMFTGAAVLIGSVMSVIIYCLAVW